MSAVQEEDGQIDPGGLFRRGFNHGAQSVKEAHGEGGDMVGIGLDLLLVNHVPDDTHFILSRQGFQGDPPPGKETCSPVQDRSLPLWEVVMNAGDGRGEDQGIAG